MDAFSLKPSKLQFGGHLYRGHPREARCLDSKRALHIVLCRHSKWKDKKLSLKQKHLEHLILRMGRLAQVKVYSMVIKEDQIHILVKLRNRRGYFQFIRSISGRLARLMLGVERGKANATKTRSGAEFWLARPFTRIVAWGPAMERVKGFFSSPKLCAVGFFMPPFVGLWSSRRPPPLFDYPLAIKRALC